MIKVEYFICNIMTIQNDEEGFLQIFSISERDSGHEDVLLLSETEHQSEEQQIEEQQREHHH